MKLLTRQVATLFGVTGKTVDRWSEIGILRPEGRGKYTFELIDIVAFAIARDLRARGIGLHQCRSVADWLRAKGLNDLQSEWQFGQHYLLTIGNEPPFHRQWTYAEVFENDLVDLAAAFSIGVPLAVIDLEAAFEHLMNKLAAPVEATT